MKKRIEDLSRELDAADMLEEFYAIQRADSLEGRSLDEKKED